MCSRASALARRVTRPRTHHARLLPSPPRPPVRLSGSSGRERPTAAPNTHPVPPRRIPACPTTRTTWLMGEPSRCVPHIRWPEPANSGCRDTSEVIRSALNGGLWSGLATLAAINIHGVRHTSASSAYRNAPSSYTEHVSSRRWNAQHRSVADGRRRERTGRHSVLSARRSSLYVRAGRERSRAIDARDTLRPKKHEVE